MFSIHFARRVMLLSLPLMAMSAVADSHEVSASALTSLNVREVQVSDVVVGLQSTSLAGVGVCQPYIAGSQRLAQDGTLDLTVRNVCVASSSSVAPVSLPSLQITEQATDDLTSEHVVDSAPTAAGFPTDSLVSMGLPAELTLQNASSMAPKGATLDTVTTLDEGQVKMGLPSFTLADGTVCQVYVSHASLDADHALHLTVQHLCEAPAGQHGALIGLQTVKSNGLTWLTPKTVD